MLTREKESHMNPNNTVSALLEAIKELNQSKRTIKYRIETSVPLMR